jgi:erythromycin esterase
MPASSHTNPFTGWLRGRAARLTHLDPEAPLDDLEPLRWMRRHNATAGVPVRFAGIDLPAAGGSLLPALAPVAGYLRQVDPEALPVIQQAMRIAESFAGASAASAAPAWSRLPAAEQDALSAILNGLTADTSARDAYMAGSVLWHLERSDPGTRILLAAHNAHIQKTPISFNGHLTTLPMGQHPHNSLGEDYLALALTSTTGHTADMRPDENAPFGFAIDNTELQPPEPGSVEAAFADAGLGLSLADLRRARHETGPAAGADRIRIQSAYLHTPVLEAFDGMLDVPASTVADDARG